MTKKQSNVPAGEALADLRQLIRREGAEEAFAALRSVCNDPKAPAPARAAAATSIFRAAGLFDKTDAAADDKPLSELTAEELAQIVRRHGGAPKSRDKPVEDEPNAFE
jgi:hypothetical protein